jgi:hypothetical protein
MHWTIATQSLAIPTMMILTTILSGLDKHFYMVC